MQFHRPPITFVEKVSVKVQDLKRSLAFYEGVIGFQVVNQTERSAELTADGKRVLLSLEQPQDAVPKQGRTTGLYHFALLLPKRSDLASIVHYFISIGLPFGSSDHLVSEALYFSDPDGNGIEIYADRDPAEWSWQSGKVEMAVDPLNVGELQSIGKAHEWKGLPSRTVMGHIHLHVSELQKTEEFYVEGLGFEVVSRFGSQALFIADGQYHHHIGLNTWNGVGAPPPASNSVGLESYTVRFSDEEKRTKIVNQLQHIGATVAEEDGALVTIDPSGNRIRLQV